LKEYNDYLEDVEDTIFNLMNDIRVQEMEEKIKKHKEEYKEVIQANNLKERTERAAIQMQLELEKRERMLRRDTALQEYEKERIAKKQEEEMLIDELATSTQSADAIIKQRVEEEKLKANAIQRGVLPTVNINFTSMSFSSIADDSENNAPFNPLDTLFLVEGEWELADEYDDPYLGQLLEDQVASAGGYTPFVTYQRCLDEAFRDLFTKKQSQIS